MRSSIAGAVLLFGVATQAGPLIDKDATPETVALYQNLRLIAREKLLFGVQFAYTVGFHEKDSQAFANSDAKELLGDNPAVLGLDFGGMGNKWTRPTPAESVYGRVIRAVRRRGGLVTVSWHMPNPATGGNVYDRGGNAVTQVLTPGTSARRKYFKNLDQAAAFYRDVRDDRGRPIPILFRPLHEQRGRWFWWGGENCTVEEYVELWKQTVRHLRDERDVHNLIYITSPNKPDTREKYLERFPGPEWVDVFGFDWYFPRDFADQINASARVVVGLAREHGKLAAITENGIRGGFSAKSPTDWYARHYVDNLKSDPVANEVAWVLSWRNGGRPYHPIDRDDVRHTVPDFKAFYEDEWSVFESDLPDMYTLPR
ncbi:MAG: glycosyl hydrolase [Planctomycetota bacterium]